MHDGCDVHDVHVMVDPRLYIGGCDLIECGEAGCLLLRFECCGMLIRSVVECKCLNWFKFLQIDV